MAVRNARLFRLQQEQNRYLGSLLATGRTITRSITLEDSLARICRTAAEALRTQECVIYEHDAARDAIICRAFYSSNDEPRRCWTTRASTPSTTTPATGRSCGAVW